MKSISMLISILVVILAGCAPAARAVANQADDAVRYIGDDVARIAANYGDDIARTSQQYADDVGRQTQYSDEALQYWDDALRASPTFNKNALVLLYRDENLTPLQDDFVRWLTDDVGLEPNQSLLYLQDVCFVVGFYKDNNDYPHKSDAQSYIEQVADYNGIPISSIVDFTESVFSLVDWLINRNDSYSPQDSAELLFNGLCLVSDIYGN